MGIECGRPLLLLADSCCSACPCAVIFPAPCSAIKRSAAAEPQQEQQDERPAKRARNTAPGPFQLATDMRGAAEEARLAGIRRQQEEAARQEAQFKVGGLVGSRSMGSMRAWRGWQRSGCVGTAAAAAQAGRAGRQVFSLAPGVWRPVHTLLEPETEHPPSPHTLAWPLQALPLNKAALAGAWKPAPLVMHALTVPEEVVLRSDARAAQRREFDATVAARQAQLEAEHQALQELQQAQEEEEEARQQRRALGHKPLPLPGRL